MAVFGRRRMFLRTGGAEKMLGCAVGVSPSRRFRRLGPAGWCPCRGRLSPPPAKGGVRVSVVYLALCALACWAVVLVPAVLGWRSGGPLAGRLLRLVVWLVLSSPLVFFGGALWLRLLS